LEKKIKIGVLGCANIAKRSFIPAIIEMKDYFHLSGIASRDKQKACEYAQMFNTTPFDGYQLLLSTGSLDAVYIPLPNALHAEWIDIALDKGLHVLVEKSLACTRHDVERLNNKARKLNLVLLECFQFRFHRQMAEIQSLVESGILGDLRSIRSTFGFPPFPDENNIRYQKKLGGGALLDAGAYTIKISQLLLGNDLYVAAAKLNSDRNREVDIWGGGFLQQIDGSLFSEIVFGFDHFYQCNLEILGSRGKLYTNRLFTAPPGFETDIILETTTQKQLIKIPSDNHFNNLLLYFHKLIQSPDLADGEYIQNVNQARLIEEFYLKSK
jgi:dTDP-3,4-didehydro-2,6-dideoxy-alpha-D-glucose 3-reductase